METQTQLIKESTIKGLEPEIQRLISSHKTTVQRLNDTHVCIRIDLSVLHRLQQAEELKRISDAQAGVTAKQLAELRLRLEAEREEAVVKEREATRQRYQQLAVSEDRQLLEMVQSALELTRAHIVPRAKQFQELQEERQKLHQLAKQEREKLEAEFKAGRWTSVAALTFQGGQGEGCGNDGEDSRGLSAHDGGGQCAPRCRDVRAQAAHSH